MGEEGGPRRRCRELLRPRGDIPRARSRRGWKCHTTRDGHLRIGLLHPMPWKHDCVPRSAPTPERPSSALRPLRPRCASGSIPGTAPARWPDWQIRLALSSQGLAYVPACRISSHRLPATERAIVSAHSVGRCRYRIFPPPIREPRHAHARFATDARSA